MTVLMDSLTRRQTVFAGVRQGKSVVFPQSRGYACVRKDASIASYVDPAAGLMEQPQSAECATFVITTDRQDRDGDVVLPSGVLLDNYRRNPVVLFAHGDEGFPVGIAQSPSGEFAVSVNKDCVTATCWFHKVTQAARECAELVRLGILKACSIGFVPIMAERIPHEKGHFGERTQVRQPRFLFRAVELMEFSICSVPVNADALRVELSAGRVKDARLVKALEQTATPLKVYSPGFTPGTDGAATKGVIEPQRPLEVLDKDEEAARVQAQESHLPHVRAGAYVCQKCDSRYFTQAKAKACCGVGVTALRSHKSSSVGGAGTEKPMGPRTDPPPPVTKAKDRVGHEHSGSTGQFVSTGQGGSAKPKQKPAAKAAVPQQQPSLKAQRAKAAHVMVDKTIQRYAEEHNEPRFAKAIGGVSFPDSEAVDVVIAGKDGRVAHGLELKTMVVSRNAKLTMKRSAMERKAAWERKNKAPYHTVCLDDSAVFNAKGPGQHDESKRRILYKRGFGSFRLSNMHEVKDMAELKRLMAMPENKLPPAAQRPPGQKPGRLAKAMELVGAA